MTRLLHALRALGRWAVALLLLFEEWGWEPLQRQLAKLGQLPPFAALERLIRRLPPHGALAVFIVPTLLLLPIKLLALWLIGRGHALVGVAVVIGAKLAGTAIVARLFTLTHDALMRLPWFAHLYTRWMGWKDTLLAQVRLSALWREARRLKRLLRRALRRPAGGRGSGST
jgi:hypothetical protein